MWWHMEVDFDWQETAPRPDAARFVTLLVHLMIYAPQTPDLNWCRIAAEDQTLCETYQAKQATKKKKNLTAQAPAKKKKNVARAEGACSVPTPAAWFCSH